MPVFPEESFISSISLPSDPGVDSKEFGIYFSLVCDLELVI